MARSVQTIKSEIISKIEDPVTGVDGLRNLTNTSSSSVIGNIIYISAYLTHLQEVLMDKFLMNISSTISNRINGTEQYYLNALLKYQHGDELVVSEDGTKFGYATINDSKKIITKASCNMLTDDTNYGELMFRVAKNNGGSLTNLSQQEVTGINAYMNKIKFAGTKLFVVSHPGDILVPTINVYYQASKGDSVKTQVVDAIRRYCSEMQFNDSLYVNGILDVVRKVSGVNDATCESGVVVAQWDSNNNKYVARTIDRFISESKSGFYKEYSGEQIFNQNGSVYTGSNFTNSISFFPDAL